MEKEKEKEREGKGKGEVGRRGRRGIVIGGIALLLVLGCNNGGEDPQKVFLKSVVSLGNEFLNVFTSFGDMVGDVLGFSEKTTKSDVGNYFKKIQETVQRTKEQLNTMVENMRKEGNPNAEATDVAVKKLINETLDKIIEGSSDAVKGAAGSELVGNIDSGAGVVAAPNEINSLIEGISKIVEVALKGKGSAEAGDDKKADVLGSRNARTANNGEAGKLFATSPIGSDHKKSAADAAKAVGAVSGADILQAIIKKDGDAAKLAKESTGNVETAPKDATIAGGIALRAMAKGGKFANDSGGDADSKKAVKGAAVSAITKALDTLTIAIRKTIDEGLKEVKKAMNINANDNPVTSETTGVAAK